MPPLETRWSLGNSRSRAVYRRPRRSSAQIVRPGMRNSWQTAAHQRQMGKALLFLLLFPFPFPKLGSAMPKIGRSSRKAFAGRRSGGGYPALVAGILPLAGSAWPLQ